MTLRKPRVLLVQHLPPACVGCTFAHSLQVSRVLPYSGLDAKTSGCDWFVRVGAAARGRHRFPTPAKMVALGTFQHQTTNSRSTVSSASFLL
jgi:hypothetical protein